MQNDQQLSTEINPMIAVKNQQQFPLIETSTSPTVDTATGAHYPSRAEQTLRKRECIEIAPLSPTRANSRLAWCLANIKRILGVGK